MIHPRHLILPGFLLLAGCGGDDEPAASAAAKNTANKPAPASGRPDIAGSNWKGVYTIVGYEVPFGGPPSGDSGGSGGGGSGTPSLPPVPELPRAGLVAKAGDSESVRATIAVHGDTMIVTTSRPAGGTAHRLTGTLRADGTFRLTDAHDGEIWSSYEGPASSRRIALLDFVKPPSAANPRPNLYKLDLRR